MAFIFRSFSSQIVVRPSVLCWATHRVGHSQEELSQRAKCHDKTRFHQNPNTLHGKNCQILDKLYIVYHIFLLPASAYGWRNMRLGLNCCFIWEYATFPFGVLGWCWRSRTLVLVYLVCLPLSSSFSPHCCPSSATTDASKRKQNCILISLSSLALDICPIVPGIDILTRHLTHSSVRLGNFWRHSSTIPAQAGSSKAGFPGL